MRSKATLAALALLLPGCALIKQGTTQTVTFRSNPPGAEFKIDDKTHRTPVTLELPKQERTLVFTLKNHVNEPYHLKCRTSGYFYWSFLGGVIASCIDWFTGAWREFDLKEDGVVLVELNPSADSSEQIVRISSYPYGATIKVNNVDLQERTGEKGQGTRVKVSWASPNDKVKRVVLRMPGYEDAHLDLRREDKTLHKDLEPQAEIVKARFESAPEGAEVLLDGRRLTTTPSSVGLEWFSNSPEKKIEFRLAGYHPWHWTLKSKADIVPPAKLREIVTTAPVRIDCVPSGTILEVDEKLLGPAPPVIELDWSVKLKSHKLKLSRPGYESHEIVIEDAKRSQPVTVRLRPALPRLP